MPSDSKPNLFIVGLPRAGTTSLYFYLKEHPDIFMSRRDFKEPHYFGQDLTRGQRPEALTQSEYLALFEGSENYSIAGEASVGTVFSETAVNEIYEFNPDAKILLILRDLADNAFSRYKSNNQMGLLSAESFEAALEQEAALLSGAQPMPTAEAWREEGYWLREGYLYKHQCLRLPGVIEAYQKRFGDQFKVVLLEDLEREPQQTYRGILEFLGVEPSFEPEWKVHNAQREVRCRSLQNFLDKYQKPLRKMRRMIWSEPIPWITKLIHLNTTTQKKEHIQPETRAQLVQELTPAIERIEALTGYDLSSWKRTA